MPRYLFPHLIEMAPDTSTLAETIGANVSIKRNAHVETDQYETALEANFPQIVKKIQILWGYPEMNTYFLSLTIDERGNREGFPPEVWDDLQVLLLIHHDLFPS